TLPRRAELVLAACMALAAGAAFGQQQRPTGFEPAIKTASAMPRLRSLLVNQRGKLVLERYFHGASASRPANVKSVSKSMISALVGIALERKLIPGVSSPIAPYFPEIAGADAVKRKITIEHLLTMQTGLGSTSGRNYGAWVRSPNWVRFALGRPVVDSPGGAMIYSTGSFHLLSAVLTKVSKKSTWELANEVLSKPLGFTLAKWPQDPQGIYLGGNEMLMTPRQMAAFGELYLRRGRAGGRQVVPEGWIEASWTPRTISPWSEQFYGYGWWMRELAGRPSYFAWGYGGQFIFVVPSLESVVVVTSSVSPGADRREHMRRIYGLVEGLVAGPLSEASN
ncbi:MAG TPA: serine hydrolase, partial [Bryobacteraceae bacterium]|nr:serine hydrolase [Bryobacteraceae bacterium]